MQRALILIFSAVLHAGLVAAAEAPTKLPSVGILTEDSSASALAVIKKALADLGDIDGKTISVQSRSAGGRIERLDEVASELAQNVDVIVAEGISAGQAGRRQKRKANFVAARGGGGGAFRGGGGGAKISAGRGGGRARRP